MLHAHRGSSFAGSDQSGLVAHVRNLGTGHAGCERCQSVCQFGRALLAPVECERRQVHAEDFLAPRDIGLVHSDLPVEATGADQRGVEHIRAVCARQHNDASRRAEPVHLDQQLVECVLALVIAAALPATTALAPNRVDLVDEDDARRERARLRKEVTHAARADADKHLDEVGARDAEEGHRRFARRRLGQQRLARARRADEQRALGHARAELCELLRVLEELDELGDLELGLVAARHVLEGDVGPLVRLDHLRLGLAHLEDGARRAADAAPAAAAARAEPA
mmetsp:Transcript_4107/g.10463  ORF Transcript_4107/g.10463 Transcript_4107/m.10463 type:complete len:282 (-) Transcript_4107:535-1380(-)